MPGGIGPPMPDTGGGGGGKSGFWLGCPGGCMGGGGASANSWWGRSVSDRGFWAASKRSAAEPCLSPLESFLKA